MKIPFSTVQFMHEEIMSELENTFRIVLSKGWFIQGEHTTAFEREFAAYCGTKTAIGCGNGLDAIVLILRAMGIGPGDEVIIPSFTFIATALAVEYVGATPIFVEVYEDTALLNPTLLEAAITKRTKAIIAVHLYGQLCNMEQISEIAQKYGLKVIEDAAQAHGATHCGLVAGNAKSDAAAFSLYPGKNLGALGDAGIITTNDLELAEIIRAIGNYGAKKKYAHEYLGVNSRLDEMQASFLSIKLKHLGFWNLERQKLAQRYLAEIKHPDIYLPRVCTDGHVWHLFVIRCEKRDALANYLKKQGIETNIHYPIAMHMQKAFQKYRIVQGALPIAERLSATVLSLPIFYGMTEEEQNYVIEIVNSFSD